MKQKARLLIPKYAIHPGKILKDELEARCIKQIDLCIKFDLNTVIINEIIKGKRNISAKTALQLEKALKINAEFWMGLQSKYEIDVLRIKYKIKPIK